MSDFRSQLKKMNTKIKKQNKVTKDMLIGDVINTFPDLAQVLIEDYGFHCVGCFASGMETLEQGAQVHGMSDEDIKVMVENLNELVCENAK